MDENHVVLQSQDGQTFKIEVKVAKMSETVKNLIEDAGTDSIVPLPNVSGKILSKVLEYCKYHVENPVAVSENKEEKRTDDIIGWDMVFVKVDQATLFELILAANYLDISGLLDLCCKSVAIMIKGKTPEEIRGQFNITNQFTPEEEEQVRKENQWCEER